MVALKERSRSNRSLLHMTTALKLPFLAIIVLFCAVTGGAQEEGMICFVKLCCQPWATVRLGVLSCYCTLGSEWAWKEVLVSCLVLIYVFSSCAIPTIIYNHHCQQQTNSNSVVAQHTTTRENSWLLGNAHHSTFHSVKILLKKKNMTGAKFAKNVMTLGATPKTKSTRDAKCLGVTLFHRRSVPGL